MLSSQQSEFNIFNNSILPHVHFPCTTRFRSSFGFFIRLFPYARRLPTRDANATDKRHQPTIHRASISCSWSADHALYSHTASISAYLPMRIPLMSFHSLTAIAATPTMSSILCSIVVRGESLSSASASQAFSPSIGVIASTLPPAARTSVGSQSTMCSVRFETRPGRDTRVDQINPAPRTPPVQ